MSTYSGTLIRDLEAAVDKRTRICANCGQPRGLHSHEHENCPSDALRGPLFLQSRYCPEQELPCVNSLRNSALGND